MIGNLSFLENAFEAAMAAGLLVIVVLCLRGPVARYFGPKAAYALWLLPLLRLVLPPVPVPDPLPIGGQGIFPAAEPSQVEFVTAPFDSNAVSPDVFFLPLVEAKESVSERPAPDPLVSRPAIDLSLWREVLKPWAVGLWALGTLLMAGWLLLRQGLFTRTIRQQTTLAATALQQDTAAIATELKLRRSPTVRLCERGSGPLVCGMISPTIVLPADFTDTFNAPERRYALLHEMTHVRRGDLFALLGFQLLAATQWFNPFAHIATRAFRIDMEAACDADVLKRHKNNAAPDYARTLLKAASRGLPPSPAPALSLDHPLKERLTMMNRQSFKGGSALAVLVIALGLGTTASYAVQDAEALNQETLDDVLAGKENDQLTEQSPAWISRGNFGREDGNGHVFIHKDKKTAEWKRHKIALAEEKIAREQERVQREIERAAMEAERQARLVEQEARRVETLAAAAERRDDEQLERQLERAEERLDRAEYLYDDKLDRVDDLNDVLDDLRDELDDLREERMEQVWISEDKEARFVTSRRSVSGEDVIVEVRGPEGVQTIDVRGIGPDGHKRTIIGDPSHFEYFSERDGGFILLTDPLDGMGERLKKLEKITQAMPDIPEPPEPPHVVVVEVKTVDGKVIKVPETTILLPGHEAEMEAYAAEVERIVSRDIEGEIEKALGDDFEWRMEASSRAIEILSEKCEAHLKKSDAPVLLTQKAEKGGAVHKAICHGEGERGLKSAALEKFVKKQRSLSDEERERFYNWQDGESYHFTFRREG